MGMSRFFVRILTLLVLTLAMDGWAHPNGVSKVILKIDRGDSLHIWVDVNRDDITNAISEAAAFGDSGLAIRDRVLAKSVHYLQSRMAVSVAGQRLNELKPFGYMPDGLRPLEKVDSAALWEKTWVISLKGQLPSKQGRLQLTVQFFAEFGVQPLSEVTVLYENDTAHVEWLGLDKKMRLVIDADSLKNRVQERKKRLAAGESASPEVGFMRFIALGFTHILPLGLDHILFVLGLFFFSTLVRPLLIQVTAFTLAHSITLALTLLGVIKLPASIVEPLIAVSIVIVGIENVFFRKLKPSRWLIVFAFGLVHGMGFAGVLHELGLPPGQFWSTLIGFNLGVEFGQLAVIAIAFLATFAFRKKAWYFKGIVVPVSLGIAAMGLYWAITRVWG